MICMGDFGCVIGMMDGKERETCVEIGHVLNMSLSSDLRTV